MVWARSGGNNLLGHRQRRLTTGTWTHLAATYNGSTLRLYVNGVSVVAAPDDRDAEQLEHAVADRRQHASWDEWFRGLIDDVRIYNRALSAAEIQTDMVYAGSAWRHHGRRRSR